MAEPRAFAAWLRLLFRHDWVVYSKSPLWEGRKYVPRDPGAHTTIASCHLQPAGWLLSPTGMSHSNGDILPMATTNGS